MGQVSHRILGPSLPKMDERPSVLRAGADSLKESQGNGPNRDQRAASRYALRVTTALMPMASRISWSRVIATV
jgi:hypothetical protein